MIRFARLLLLMAVLFTMVMALQPAPAVVVEVGDKLQHVAAFFTLAILSRLSFPRTHAACLFSGLALLGAVIEFAQMIPALNRQADLGDWIADIAAAAVGLVAGSLLNRLFARS